MHFQIVDVCYPSFSWAPTFPSRILSTNQAMQKYVLIVIVYILEY